MPVQGGEQDVPQGGLALDVLHDRVGEDHQSRSDHEPRQRTADDHHDDAQDRHDPLAHRDDLVPVIGDRVDRLLPPVAVVDACVGGLVELGDRAVRRVLPQTARLLGQALGCLQRRLGRGDGLLGVRLLRLGRRQVPGGLPHLVGIRWRHRLARVLRRVVGVGRRGGGVHPVRGSAQGALRGGQLVLGGAAVGQRPVRLVLRVLQVRPVGLQRLSGDPVYASVTRGQEPDTGRALSARGLRSREP